MLAALAVLAGLAAGTGCKSATAQPAPAPAAAPDARTSIPFDHSLHAGRNAIPCLACHTSADKSPVAGIPSVRRCMGCHRFVASDKQPIQALSQLFKDGQAPSWPRVYDLPDHVYFSHRMHIRAGLDCSKCHGNVAAMSKVTRVSPMKMGWCMTCHKQRGASTECITCHK
ncbi:MAG TPA: cytochrome c3 family protein [Polyangiales bacterium]